MKRILVLCLSFAILFALSGCATGSPNGTSSINNSSTAMNNNSTEKKNTFEDGTYRGGYIDSKQIEIEISLKGNKFEAVKFRALSYRDVDYLKSEEKMMVAIRTQYQQLADYLVGKDVSALKELYTPEKIAKDVDAVTAATLRSSKMISAINDALNRGVYSYPK